MTNDYRSGTVKSNTVNSNFGLNSKFSSKSTHDFTKHKLT